MVHDADKSEDLEIASRYLALPRILGKDENGNEVLAQKGKYGPYISCDKKTRKLNRLDKDQQLFSLTLEEALELLSKEPEKGSGGKAGRGSAKASVIKELGQFEKKIQWLLPLDATASTFVSANRMLPYPMSTRRMKIKLQLYRWKRQ